MDPHEEEDMSMFVRKLLDEKTCENRTQIFETTLAHF